MATNPPHSRGPTCIFQDEEIANSSSGTVDAPYITAQFFYVSQILIDDPLSPVPPVLSNTKPSQSRQPQPFSARDNAALLEAWRGVENILTSTIDKNARQARPELGERGKTLGELVRFPRFKGDGRSAATTSYSKDDGSDPVSGESPERSSFRPPGSRFNSSTILSSYQKLRKPPEKERQAVPDEATEHASQKRPRHLSPLRKTRSPEEDVAASISSTGAIQLDGEIDTDISGRPFARAPTMSPIEVQDDLLSESRTLDAQSHQREVSSGGPGSPSPSKIHGTYHPHKQEPDYDRLDDDKAYIPVGASRLHLVEMPDLLMKPIYWNPLNDISAVLRGTWFYSVNMLPVEPDLANWLEAGYQELKPWTDTWQDELNSCVEIGADAEMKIVYHLFPERKSSRPGTGAEAKADRSDLAERDPWLMQPSVGHENLAAGPRSEKYHTWTADVSQRYRNHRVIYVNAHQAQILRPSLAPSVSRNRKPLAAIRKGREIGVAVARGFRRPAWEKLHPQAKTHAKAAHAQMGAYMSQSRNAATQDQDISCPACRIEEQKRSPRMTDLVLVIHGIGQKLSERMDSFHFTHAINSFRREVNMELASEIAPGVIRNDQGGIMVLPVNWRLGVSFEDGTETKNLDQDNQFQLEDITPSTLPAIRSLISDVMLDIPYYLSHHKQKMISAVIREANRIYRLWLKNNQGFHDHGRVHLIAHSLGSAMAMDILSQQPTKPPKGIDVSTLNVNENMFEFDTKNLFLCGSPAGFFLLLHRANLIPRGDRQKPGIDPEDERGITGEAGRFGCLAVDNIYNVMAPFDPISYGMNAAIDREYAASLRPGTIPSMRQGILASIGWGASSTQSYGLSSKTASVIGQRPAINKLPSAVEMDIHDFDREKIAERRALLLNDSGQIDFTLPADGGFLDFQYINMLSSHNMFWRSREFVRFLVVEIGRKQGREGTLPALRAQKKRVFKAGKIA